MDTFTITDMIKWCEIMKEWGSIRTQINCVFTELKDSKAAIYFDEIVGKYFNLTDTGGSLKSHIQNISGVYNRCLGSSGVRPDWSDTNNRRAYIYRFFMMHSYLVYSGLKKLFAEHGQLVEAWKSNACLRVCCIGGGPGSDLVGLVKFLRDGNILPVWRLQCTVLDLQTDWENDWRKIRNANPGEFPLNVTYVHSDMTKRDNSLNTAELAAIQSADIVTMVKSFSPIAACIREDKDRGNRLRRFFQEMKPGALLLYIDNYYSDQHEELRDMTRWGAGDFLDNPNYLFKWDGTVQMNITNGHNDSALRSSQTVGVEPLQRCKVSIMILRKPT